VGSWRVERPPKRPTTPWLCGCVERKARQGHGGSGGLRDGRPDRGCVEGKVSRGHNAACTDELAGRQ
jgi:hypothetical protein